MYISKDFTLFCDSNKSVEGKYILKYIFLVLLRVILALYDILPSPEMVSEMYVFKKHKEGERSL
jgi:hypothetical protein